MSDLTAQMFGPEVAKSRSSTEAGGEGSAALARPPAWKLEEAKARFSEIVRLAREPGPQRVTVYSKDAVVILSVDDFAKLVSRAEQPKPHALLSNSPLKDLRFEIEGVSVPVRDVAV